MILVTCTIAMVTLNRVHNFLSPCFPSDLFIVVLTKNWLIFSQKTQALRAPIKLSLAQLATPHIISSKEGVFVFFLVDKVQKKG